MNYKVVIPARYGSTRLPGKPLLDIGGKPMIQHVFERAAEAGFSPEHEIIIATDDERIAKAAKSFGALAMMTSVNCASGTDRLNEVAERLGWGEETIVVNLQGDEPLMPPALIRSVAEYLAASEKAGIATLATPIEVMQEVLDPNIVKVVTDKDQYAMYFSRASIPWVRGVYSDIPNELPTNSPCGALRHLGLYAYRVSTLQRLTATEMPTVERLEALEQLRALWLGIKIYVGLINEAPGHGIDTESDLARVKLLFNT